MTAIRWSPAAAICSRSARAPGVGGGCSRKSGASLAGGAAGAHVGVQIEGLEEEVAAHADEGTDAGGGDVDALGGEGLVPGGGEGVVAGDEGADVEQNGAERILLSGPYSAAWLQSR
ncbi:MAG: hypothetical protein R3F59_21860 [Myxococcota bacterium]